MNRVLANRHSFCRNSALVLTRRRLLVPLTLLAHHARHHEIEYLLGQTFLAPHPKELMLRNHV